MIFTMYIAALGILCTSAVYSTSADAVNDGQNRKSSDVTNIMRLKWKRDCSFSCPNQDSYLMYCGSDNQLYFTTCELNLAKCHVRDLHLSTDPGMACPELVSGTNGTISNAKIKPFKNIGKILKLYQSMLASTHFHAHLKQDIQLTMTENTTKLFIQIRGEWRNQVRTIRANEYNFGALWKMGYDTCIRIYVHDLTQDRFPVSCADAGMEEFKQHFELCGGMFGYTPVSGEYVAYRMSPVLESLSNFDKTFNSSERLRICFKFNDRIPYETIGTLKFKPEPFFLTTSMIIKSEIRFFLRPGLYSNFSIEGDNLNDMNRVSLKLSTCSGPLGDDAFLVSEPNSIKVKNETLEVNIKSEGFALEDWVDTWRKRQYVSFMYFRSKSLNTEWKSKLISAGTEDDLTTQDILKPRNPIYRYAQRDVDLIVMKMRLCFYNTEYDLDGIDLGIVRIVSDKFDSLQMSLLLIFLLLILPMILSITLTCYARIIKKNCERVRSIRLLEQQDEIERILSQAVGAFER